MSTHTHKILRLARAQGRRRRADNPDQLYFDFGDAADLISVSMLLALDTPQSCLERGCRAEDAGQFEEAAAAFERGLALGGEPGVFRFNLGNVAFAQGEMSEAVEHYRRATDLAPADAAAWNNLGVALAETGELMLARRALERALQLDPISAEARENLADLPFSRFDPADSPSAAIRR